MGARALLERLAVTFYMITFMSGAEHGRGHASAEVQGKLIACKPYPDKRS